MTQIKPPVRVRFAPSPTGYLHIGGVRTALFNWLFARHYGGQFIVRIEDTDEKRFVEGAADDMMASLRWIGIIWDEGPDVDGPHSPYIQSQRSEMGIYRQHVEQLLEQGLAYKSFVTEEELAQMRADAQARGVKSFRFRGVERDWSLEQMAEVEAQGKPYTVRLKTPLEGTTSFTDLIRGGDQITVNHNELQDIVLLKSSGMPVYHLAHLVDDHLMGITHVIRGEEWVPSTPYHILLYKAFGWELPTFAHVPNILRQDGRGKLSKRKDDVGANRFWERGYLAEAMFNYLALQGWSYDDHTEIMTVDEVIERFTIDRVLASPARWNPEKLKDMNGIYIRKLSTAELVDAMVPFLVQADLVSDASDATQRDYLMQLAPLIHERLEELSEAPELLEFFFHEVAPTADAPLSYDPAHLVQKKIDATTTHTILKLAYERLTGLDTWDKEHIEEVLRTMVSELGLKAGQLFGTIRVAATGRTVAPPLFETLVALGQEQSLKRIALAERTFTE